MTSPKKYILKPGKHQFAPGSPAVHDNDNLSDIEAEWYMERYPHIKALFTPRPPEGEENKEEEMKVEKQLKEEKHSDQVDYLTPPLGGKGGE
jgi:hypothetical protein